MNKKELVKFINEYIKKENINVPSYRNYVTESGKNGKFLYKISKKIKSEHPELFKKLSEFIKK